jgi:hypothetical protein
VSLKWRDIQSLMAITLLGMNALKYQLYAAARKEKRGRIFELPDLGISNLESKAKPFDTDKGGFKRIPGRDGPG